MPTVRGQGQNGQPKLGRWSCRPDPLFVLPVGARITVRRARTTLLELLGREAEAEAGGPRCPEQTDEARYGVGWDTIDRLRELGVSEHHVQALDEIDATADEVRAAARLCSERGDAVTARMLLEMVEPAGEAVPG